MTGVQTHSPEDMCTSIRAMAPQVMAFFVARFFNLSNVQKTLREFSAVLSCYHMFLSAAIKGVSACDHLISVTRIKLIGGLVAIFYFPMYWVSNHPN